MFVQVNLYGAFVELAGTFKNPIPDLKQVRLKHLGPDLLTFGRSLVLAHLLVEFGDVDEAILLLVLSQLQLEPLILLLQHLIRRLHVIIVLLKLVTASLLRLENLLVIRILKSHLFSLIPQIVELRLLVFDVTVTLLVVVFELLIQFVVLVVPVLHFFGRIRHHSLEFFDLFREGLAHIGVSPF